MKAQLDHGLFLLWLKSEMGLEPRTAQNFMQAAERFEGKSEIVSHLPPTVLYKLAAPSTPEPVLTAVLKRIEAGETIQPKAIEVEIREARDEAVKRAKAEKEEARRAALTEEEREEEDALKSRGEKGRLARERRAKREQERMDRERHQRQELERREATAASRILLNGLGPDVAASFCARFEADYGATLRMLMRLAQVERARNVEAIEIDTAEIGLIGTYADRASTYQSDWPDEAEVRALAEEIERDGLQEPIVLMDQSEVGRQGRRRYIVMDGSRRFRAVRDILGWPRITARIAPAIEPLPDPDA